MSKTPRIFIPSAVRKYVFERDKTNVKAAENNMGKLR